MSSTIHLQLDVCGSVPALGEVCDGTNALFYLVEGDVVNAALSGVSMLPTADWTKYSKYAQLIIKNANGNDALLVFREGVDGLIKFGSKTQEQARGHLRSILGLATGDTRKAHHIMPWEFRDHPLIQAAARYKDGPPFHINDLLNGIPLPNDVHQNGHAAYNTMIRNYLNDVILPNLDTANPKQAYDELIDIINSLKSQLESGLPLDQISLP